MVIWTVGCLWTIVCLLIIAGCYHFRVPFYVPVIICVCGTLGFAKWYVRMLFKLGRYNA